MLNKKEKAVMKIIYLEAIKKNNVCLLRPIDILVNIPYKLSITEREVTQIINDLGIEDYYEVLDSFKKNEKYLCFTLHQKGLGFSRELLSEKRAIYKKIIFTVAGVIGAFILKKLLELI